MLLAGCTIAEIVDVHCNVLLSLTMLLGTTMHRCRTRVHHVV